MTDQQPEATRNASCKLFQCSREPPFFIPTVAMSGGESKKQLLRPDVVQVTGVSDTLMQTLMSLQEETRLYPLSSLAACSSALSEAADPSNRWEATTA